MQLIQIIHSQRNKKNKNKYINVDPGQCTEEKRSKNK